MSLVPKSVLSVTWLPLSSCLSLGSFSLLFLSSGHSCAPSHKSLPIPRICVLNSLINIQVQGLACYSMDLHHSLYSFPLHRHAVFPVQSSSASLIFTISDGSLVFVFFHVFSTFFVCLFLLHLFICVAMNMDQGIPVVVRGQILELVLSFHHMDPQDQTQFICLGGKCLYPLS